MVGYDQYDPSTMPLSLSHMQHGTVFMEPSQQMLANPDRKLSEVHVTLTVMHLPGTADVSLLHDIFAPYGRVTSAQIDVGPGTGNGTVVMEGLASAQCAVHALNGAILFEGSRPIVVLLSSLE